MKKANKKDSFSGQQHQRDKEAAGAGLTGDCAEKPVSQSPHKKEAIYNLPDFSADWQMPTETASKAEVKARFFYEFARESQTVLILTERLCHFTSGEILRSQKSCRRYPGEALQYLHPWCSSIAMALMPRINLRNVSWKDLQPEQRESLIRVFSGRQPAFREQKEWELGRFIDERLYATKPPVGTTQPDIYPQWFGSSLLYSGGVEYVAILIDWTQGPQAVKAAMEQWLQRHKRMLLRLKLEGKLPDRAYGFHLRDETGAKNPRRKYLTALRGLGAMRLLGGHTLAEAIRITEGSLFSRDIRSRSAWNVGVKRARQKFQELFYSQDDYLLRFRRCNGLPDIEEPISYKRLLSRRENK
jgi:hypothetical protein